MGEATADRKKWTAVGALALVLAGVLWSQFAPTSDVPSVELADRPKKTAKSVERPGSRTPWTAPPLEEVVGRNPFQPLRIEEPMAEAPAPEADPQATAEEASIATFRGRKVRAVFMTKRGPVAMLDQTLVREGEIVDGMRVLAIRADGIIVEPAE